MAAESDIEQCPNKEAARQRNSVMLNQPEKHVLQDLRWARRSTT